MPIYVFCAAHGRKADPLDADFIVVGAGTAGLPAAIRAAERGASVLLFDGETSIGGTLRYARELSAAATRQQREKGIADSGEAHFQEVTALAKGAANESLLRLAVDNAADTIAFMNERDEPWIAFKVMAAGSIRPKEAFQYAFENGADFICAGMYDFQIVEDANIALDALANAQNRKRRWTA